MRVERRSARGRGPRGVAAVVGFASMLALGSAGSAHAASAVLEVTPMIGWQWGGTLDYSTGGDVHANAALNYGGAIGAQLAPGSWGEISYTYQSTEVRARPPAGADFKLFDLATHYIQASGARDLMPGREGRAFPYVIGGLGMTIFSPGSSGTVRVDTQYLFSISAGLGLRIAMGERLDLRLQSRLLLPMNFESGGFYFGSGGGAVTVSGGTVLPQGEATLCVTIKLAGSQ